MIRLLFEALRRHTLAQEAFGTGACFYSLQHQRAVSLQGYERRRRSMEGEAMAGRRMVDQKTLNDIIRRIVEVAHPEKIILFGSAVRGEMGPNSDVDLLIIKRGADALNVMAQIYRNLHGVGAAVDAIVVTPEDVERFKESHALVIKPALREGKVVYAAS